MSDKIRQNQQSGADRIRAARRRAKKRHNTFSINFKRLFLLTAGVLLVLFISVSGIKGLISIFNSAQMINGNDTIQTAEEKLKKSVMIDEVDIAGMTRQQAKAAIENAYPWSMKAHLADSVNEVYNFDNLLDLKLDKILEEVYANEDSVKSVYSLSFDDMSDEISNEVKKIQSKWDIAPKNGSISGFDKETKSFTYEQESVGYLIDKEKLTEDIKTALSRKNYADDISVIRNETQPTITASEAKEKYRVIGTLTTKTTDNKDRNTNISLAASALDGLIIKPGEEFSFNNTTGNRTTDRGYRPAGAYVNGVMVEEPGGGVCQVSSTLYNAVIFSGLKTTERHAHSFEPSYVTPGEDAMVSYDGYAGPDMKFVNTSDTSIAIRAALSGQTLTCSIIGIPILEDGISVEMTSEKVSDIAPPPPEYIEDKSIAEGSQVVVREAKKGSKWTTRYVVKKDGTVIKNEEFHNSIYKGKPATIKVHSVNIGQSQTEASGTDISDSVDGSDISFQNTDANLTETAVEDESIKPAANETAAGTESEKTDKARSESTKLETGTVSESTDMSETSKPVQSETQAAKTTETESKEEIVPIAPN